MAPGEHPGRPYVDVWGWYAPIQYQRSKSVDLGYYETSVFREAFKRGANYSTIHGLFLTPDEFSGLYWDGPGAEQKNLLRCGLVLNWLDYDPWKRPEGFLNFHHPYWNRERLLAVCKLGHKYGHLVEFSVQEGFVFTRKTKRKTIFVQPHVIYTQKGHKDEIEKQLYGLKWTARNLANSLEQGWEKTSDGFMFEHWFPDNRGRSAAAVWEYDPGHYLSWHTYPRVQFPAPNYIFQWGYAFPADVEFISEGYLSGAYGRRYVALQTSCRSRRFPDANTYGGSHEPDFVLQHCNCFLRKRALNKDERLSHVFVLGEPLETCPGEKRQYVYAVLQDPLRCAVTMPITNVYNQAAQVLAVEDGLVPAGTPFIQNNYFRLYIHKDRDGGFLDIDRNGSANFSRLFTTPAFPVDTTRISQVLTNHVTGYYNVGEGNMPRFLLHPVKKRMSYLEIGGYKAVLQEERDQREMFDSRTQRKYNLSEKRRYTMISDSPYFVVDIERTVHPAPQDLVTIFSCDGYDRLVVGDEAYCGGADFSAVPSVVELRDSKGRNADMALLIVNRGNLSNVAWFKNSHLELRSRSIRGECMRIAAVLARKFRPGELRALSRALATAERPVSFDGDKPAVVRNEFDVPLVRAVRVENPDDGPYFVNEYGWWIFRGAQVSKWNRGKDYVKVYLPPEGRALIRKYGYIGGVVKPGWGCQYTIALKDIRKKINGGSCTARVVSVTPMVFAPRLQFKEPVAAVVLNGNGWHYFDENMVFLPNRKGTYHVVVRYGKPRYPHLTRTLALVDRMQWKGDILLFRTRLPVWTKKMPDGLRFTATVRTSGRRIKRAGNCEIVRETKDGVLIRFRPGKVSMCFET